MSTILILIAILLVPVAIMLAAITVGYTLYYLSRLRRRHQRDRQQQPLSDREVADALAPFGADISVWPSRAPKNGSAHE